jgi:uncharacterized protein (DUF2147 family)
MTTSGWLAGAGFVGAALVSQLALAPVANAAGLIEGTWLTPQQSEMTISSCVEGFCGYISKIVITDDIRAKYGSAVDTAVVFTDYNNKDPNLKDRPIEGLQILTLRQGADPWHFEGEIYNPEDGNTYAGFLEVTGPETMKLKGCAYVVICLEQEWTRVPAVAE